METSVLCALSVFTKNIRREKKPTIIKIWSSENQECHLFLPPAARYWPESLFILHHCSTALVHFIYIKEHVLFVFLKHMKCCLKTCGVCLPTGLGSTSLLNRLHPPVLLLKVIVVNLGSGGLREANDGATAL